MIDFPDDGIKEVYGHRGWRLRTPSNEVIVAMLVAVHNKIPMRIRCGIPRESIQWVIPILKALPVFSQSWEKRNQRVFTAPAGPQFPLSHHTLSNAGERQEVAVANFRLSFETCCEGIAIDPGINEKEGP